jgi:hypothetical protein
VTLKNEKGLKPWLLRSVAIIIGICYLMAPLQHGLKELTHFLSHSLDQGVGHHSFTSHFQYDDGQTGVYSYTLEAHEHIESGETGGHSHSHTGHTKPHKHEILDFMNMAFSSPVPIHHDSDKGMVPFNLDKHLVASDYNIAQNVPNFIRTYFSTIRKNTSKGIQFLIVPPPKPLCSYFGK